MNLPDWTRVDLSGRPRLGDVAPDVARELERALRERGEPALAATAGGLRVHGPCGCGDSFCASVRTAPRDAPGEARASFGFDDSEIFAVDVVDDRIDYIEILLPGA